MAAVSNSEAHKMTPRNTTVDENDHTYDNPIVFDIKENVAYATITNII